MLTGAYFDGKTTKRHTVRLTLSKGLLEVSGEGIALTVAADTIVVSEPLGAAPRTLRLENGGLIEVTPGIALDTLLVNLRHRPGLAATLHSRWHWATASLLLIIAIFAAGYHWGLPWLARMIAPAVPDAVVRALSENTLQTLDQHLLKRTQLSAKRQTELQAGFARLIANDPELRGARLLFRSAPTAGPNALALPDGTVVLFDELLPLARRDEEILAVLTHELGHVHHRHGIRQGIQSSLLAVGAATILGDVSAWATMVSTLVLTSAYSREMEEESDDYAIERFRQLGLALDALPTMLTALDASRRKMAGDAQPGESRIFSTHPDITERIRRLQPINQ